MVNLEPNSEKACATPFVPDQKRLSKQNKKGSCMGGPDSMFLERLPWQRKWSLQYAKENITVIVIHLSSHSDGLFLRFFVNLSEYWLNLISRGFSITRITDTVSVLYRYFRSSFFFCFQSLSMCHTRQSFVQLVSQLYCYTNCAQFFACRNLCEKYKPILLCETKASRNAATKFWVVA